MRTSGILMHISSLPGEYGTGTLGREALSFVDFLARAGQTWWQTLPVGPVGFGGSPYQSVSSFAGNVNFIDPEPLCRDGLADEAALSSLRAPETGRLDFEFVESSRAEFFDGVAKRFAEKVPSDFEDFQIKNAAWLDDYALFSAIKEANGGAPFWLWERGARLREPETMTRLGGELAGRVFCHKALQYLFYKQWGELRAHAARRGVKLLGDLPIYAAEDSSDVWAHPEFFLLDGDSHPVEVAGCPPDAFSDSGQLWGNPLYNWELMKRDGFAWWTARLSHALTLFDALRLDHFRGFDSFYSIPFGADSARGGRWNEGPGADFFDAVRAKLGALPFIAEDLGYITDSVISLRERAGLCGMKVLQFAFCSDENNAYLPHNHIKNCVVYTGTHDNDTLLGWYESAPEGERSFAERYLGSAGARETAAAMTRAALASVADTAVLTMQDVLGLGGSARMNTPSTVGKNWEWRAANSDVTEALADELYIKTDMYGRATR